jgi:hypothetical protein
MPRSRRQPCGGLKKPLPWKLRAGHAVWARSAQSALRSLLLGAGRVPDRKHANIHMFVGRRCLGGSSAGQTAVLDWIVGRLRRLNRRAVVSTVSTQSVRQGGPSVGLIASLKTKGNDDDRRTTPSSAD